MAKIKERKEEKAGETMKAYEGALERHEDIQTKKTVARMKDSQKKAEKFNKKSRLVRRKPCPVQTK